MGVGPYRFVPYNMLGFSGHLYNQLGGVLMRLIKNQPMVQTLSENLVSNEMSDIAQVLASPTMLATWYRPNPDLSRLVDGWNNVTDYIGPTSTVVYDKILKFPLCGVDNLISQSQWDDEQGNTEDFQSSGAVFPNTAYPIPHSCFILDGAEMTALYVVTDAHPTTLRSNPFVEFNFKLFSRDPEMIRQLERQVNKTYTVSLGSHGLDKSFLIAEDVADQVRKHVEDYVEMAMLYKSLFYSEEKAAFVFDGLPDPETGKRRASFIDMTLWKYMFDEGIVIYDDLINYANANYDRNITRIFSGCPDILIDDFQFRSSIIWRLYTQDRRNSFDEYRYPQIYEGNPRITKYQGLDIWYLEAYVKEPSNPDKYGMFYIWDDEFRCRIRNNDPYELPDADIIHDSCAGCKYRCYGEPVACFNPYLRNVIIKWYNGETDINWDGLQIADVRTIENYYLIPIVMGIYKKYIKGIQ